MRKFVSIAVVAASLSGCVTGSYSDLEEYAPHLLTIAETRQVEADMLRHLKSRDGLFSGLKAAVGLSGSLVVCGWVRQRDDTVEHASYPLNRPFAARYSTGPGRLAGFRMVHFADLKSEAPPLYSYCARHGISL